MGSFVVSCCLTLVRSSLMLAMVISRNWDSLAKERKLPPLSPWFHWLWCGKRSNDCTCKNDKTSKQDYFRERVWDPGFLRDPKSKLGVLSFPLVPFLPLMKQGAGAKGGGSLNGLFSLGQWKNVTDATDFVTPGFLNNSKKYPPHFN